MTTEQFATRHIGPDVKSERHMLTTVGYDNAAHLESGVNGWIAEGKPTEPNKS